MNLDRAGRGRRNRAAPFVLNPSRPEPEFCVHGPRANWKGFLRLSLVTCPVALYPATSESEKISFNQLNRQTGHRIKYLKVDAETSEEVPNEDIVKGYELEKGQYIEVSKEELEEIALESTRTIEIDEFVDKSDITRRGTEEPPKTRGQPDGHEKRRLLLGTWRMRGLATTSFPVLKSLLRECRRAALQNRRQSSRHLARELACGHCPCAVCHNPFLHLRVTLAWASRSHQAHTSCLAYPSLAKPGKRLMPPSMNSVAPVT